MNKTKKKKINCYLGWNIRYKIKTHFLKKKKRKKREVSGIKKKKKAKTNQTNTKTNLKPIRLIPPASLGSFLIV